MELLRDPVTFINNWLQGLLVTWGVPQTLAAQIISGVGAAILPLLAIMFVIFLIWYERKLIGRLQDRPGPNRVGAVWPDPAICRYDQDLYQGTDHPRRRG